MADTTNNNQGISSEMGQILSSAIISLNETAGGLKDAISANTEAHKQSTDAVFKSIEAEKQAKATDEAGRTKTNPFGDSLSQAGKLLSKTGIDVPNAFKVNESDAALTKFGKYINQGIFQATSTGEAMFGGASGALHAGLGLAGAAGVAAALFAIREGIKQIGAFLSENVSYTVLSKSYTSALRTEFQLGNFRGGQGAFGLAEYQIYRNQMRQMGIRDDDQIAKSLSEIVEKGIAGGVARADAVQAAISRAAIAKTLGLDISADAIGGLYRSTQSNRGMFATAGGAFDLQVFAQNFASLAKASENVNGVQVSIKEWYSIFDKLKDRFRGTDNDFGIFQRNLVRYSKVLTENQATVGDVTELLSASARMSDSAMFKMFALSGTAGGDLFGERLGFIRRGMRADGSGWNALEVAKYMLHYGSMVGGSDAGRRDYFMRQELREKGLYGIEKHVPDLDKFFSSILAGDDKITKEFDDLSKSTDRWLKTQADKLDLIQEPVKHIRDLLFGLVSSSSVARILYGTVQDIIDKGAGALEGKPDQQTYEEAVRKKLDAEQAFITSTQATNSEDLATVAKNTDYLKLIPNLMSKFDPASWAIQHTPLGKEE